MTTVCSLLHCMLSSCCLARPLRSALIRGRCSEVPVSQQRHHRLARCHDVVRYIRGRTLPCTLPHAVHQSISNMQRNTITGWLGSRRTHLLFGRFAHSFNGGPVCAMGSIVISVKRRLAWTPPSPQFFLLSEVRFQRCAETPRRRSKSAQRRAASSSPWSTFLSTVRSDLPYAQPTSELFDLKIRPRILNIHTTPRPLCVAVAPGASRRESLSWPEGRRAAFLRRRLHWMVVVGRLHFIWTTSSCSLSPCWPASDLL